MNVLIDVFKTSSIRRKSSVIQCGSAERAVMFAGITFCLESLTRYGELHNVRTCLTCKVVRQPGKSIDLVLCSSSAVTVLRRVRGSRMYTASDMPRWACP
jgi:hypothetical protein